MTTHTGSVHHHTHGANVGNAERMVTTAVGAGLIATGVAAMFRGRPLVGLAAVGLGAAVAGRGVTGKSPIYKALGIEPEDAGWGSNPLSRHAHIRHAVTINSTAEELYRRWRDLENLPDIMSNLRRVEKIDETRSRWTARGPMGADVSWEAEITEDEPGRRIAWRSLPGSTVETEGRVEFETRPSDRGVILRVDLAYRPTGGALGTAISKLFGADPTREVINDLRKFKQLVETGEVATNASPSTRTDRSDYRDAREDAGRASQHAPSNLPSHPGETEVKTTSIEGITR